VLNLRLLDGSVYQISDAQFRAHDKFIRRNRAPRVQIEYDVELYGSVKKVQLPFVMGVMADLSGALPGDLAPVSDRKFVQIDRDNFDDRMQAMTRPLSLRVPNTLAGSGELAVELHVRSLDDFSPQAVAHQLFPSEPPGDRLSEQLNHILHHERFQRLEGTWRGLHYLVDHTETNEMLKIRVLDISKEELAKTLRKYKGSSWDQSPIFKKLYEEEYGTFGGEPFGSLVGDYYFDHSPLDVELLREMARICAAMHAPFITGTAPSMLQMETWNDLERPRDLEKIIMPPEYAAFRSLRDTEDARYLALTLPRFLSRLPYGCDTNPVEDFAFEEDTNHDNPNTFTWSNSAYLMATNINRAFASYGWCARIRGIESGGAIDGLPVYNFPTDDGSVDMKCPTEIAISDRRELELSKLGFTPLLHRKNSDMAAYISAQSLQKPAEYDMPEATANAALAARLPYLFAVSRFAHYVKCIVRDRIGNFMEVSDIEQWLNKWIMQYVDNDPEHSTESAQAHHPLAAAEVALQRPDDPSGYITAQLYLRPHYQLEGLTTSIRITTRLPNPLG
jgi:type VI secretion system protein ImpC